MTTWFDRLTPKITVLMVLFAVLTGAATAVIVTHGFRQTQHTATERSAKGLEAQGRDALLALTEREAALTSARFTEAAQVGKIAAGYLVATVSRGISSWNGVSIGLVA